MPTNFKSPAHAALDQNDIQYVAKAAKLLNTYCSERIVGQKDLLNTLTIALFTGGHVLLESVPGLAKTTAAKTLSEAIDANITRIQCTPDLMPSDIIGTQIYNEETHEFETILGPAFSNLVLLDEVNRSSAKTQSAMLELMQEKQVTIGGETHQVPKKVFMVIATQNPIEQEGTYPLSEAQMDRFLFKEEMTYPSPEEEKAILDIMESGIFSRPHKVLSLMNVAKCQSISQRVYASDAIKTYITHIAWATRHPQRLLNGRGGDYIKMGVSPRASIALLSAAKTLAVLQGRDFVIPEDVKDNRYRALRHRIAMNYAAKVDNISVERVIDAIFDEVPIP